MPKGYIRRLSGAEKLRRQHEEKIAEEPIADALRAGDTLYRGFMDELIKDPGQKSLTVWMLAWRCKRCGHAWPVRRRRRTKGTGGDYLEAKAHSSKPAPQPKKCPGCDTPWWWKDYVHGLDSPWRRGRKRRATMLKQVREKAKGTQV